MSVTSGMKTLAFVLLALAAAVSVADEGVLHGRVLPLERITAKNAKGDETKKTFVVVTHELPSIYKIADRAAMFDKARRGMIALGDPRVLKETSEDPFVVKFFNRGESNGK